jgi:hypothetical protein
MKARTLLFVGWLIVGGLGGYYTEILAVAESAMTQTVSGGGVTVKATYVNPKSNDDPRFQVVLETHSVNLDAYDLKSITVLRDDAGKTHLATGVETKGSGHHREATLTFPKVSPESKRLELVIKEVGGVKERTFRWDLQ